MSNEVTITNMDLTYMSMAIVLGSASKSLRRKVGALIVDYSLNVPRIVCEGFNGTEAGSCNLCEDLKTGKTLPNVIHAEINALNKLERQSDKFGNKLVLYVTVKPCVECTKSIIANGSISRIFYCFDYDTISNEQAKYSNSLLVDSGIKTKQITVDRLKEKLDIDFFNINYTGLLRELGVSDSEINTAIINKLNRENE